MSNSRPNILVFLTDDHGRWASGAYGNSEIVSPTMDWLACEGVRMNNAFTPSPVCSPARASFWTGRFPSAHGIHDYLRDYGLTEPLQHPGIAGQNTLATHLKNVGYRTGLVGKWHCHHTEEHQPGFDTWAPLAFGTNARFGNQGIYDNGKLMEWHGHQAPRLTERALQFLREERGEDEPFFLFVGYTDTHTPHNAAPARLKALYADATFGEIPEEAYSDVHGIDRIRPYEDKDDWRQELIDYYATVTGIDEQMGRVIDELESMGELQNTLIVYTGDHGHMNGHHGLHTKGNATVPQNLLDESVMVPQLLRLPGVFQAGVQLDTYVDHTDLRATLMDLAGADWAAINREDLSPGRSYLSILQGEKDPADWRDFQVCEYGNARMIRTEGAKLILRYPAPNGMNNDEFYDLIDDPRERENRINDPKYATLVKALKEQLISVFSARESDDPTVNGKTIAQTAWTNDWMPWDVTAEEVHKRLGR